METKNLHQTLLEEFGKRAIEQTEMPSCITQNLNQKFAIRPYQKRAFQYALNYFDPQGYDGKPRQNEAKRGAVSLEARQCVAAPAAIH